MPKYSANDPYYRSQVQRAADALGVPFGWVDTVFFIESGRDTTAYNSNTGASGIWQLTAPTAGDIGMDLPMVVFRALPLYDQVTYYIKNTKRWSGYNASPYALYLVNFYPAARSWPVDKAFPQYVYDVNKGLDFNGNGILTVGDIADKVAAVGAALGYNFTPPANYQPVSTVSGYFASLAKFNAKAWYQNLTATQRVLLGLGFVVGIFFIFQAFKKQ